MLSPRFFMITNIEAFRRQTPYNTVGIAVGARRFVGKGLCSFRVPKPTKLLCFEEHSATLPFSP